MADTSGLITLEQAVKKILLKSKKPLTEFDRFLELSIDAYRELRLKTVNEGVNYVKRIPSNINTVDFPEDLEHLVAVGVPVDGELWFLTPEHDIIKTTSDELLQEILDSSDGEGVDIYRPELPSYSTRGGINVEGYYTVDHNKRRVVINSVNRTEVIVVYVSSGTSTTETTYIPYKYLPALEAWVMWQDSAYIEGMENRAQMLEANWNRRRQELAELELDFDSILNEIYKSYTMLPKR